MAEQPQADSRPRLLGVRASVILALSVMVGSAAAGLTVASDGDWASALLAGGTAAGGAIALFKPDHRGHRRCPVTRAPPGT